MLSGTPVHAAGRERQRQAPAGVVAVGRGRPPLVSMVMEGSNTEAIACGVWGGERSQDICVGLEGIECRRRGRQ